MHSLAPSCGALLALLAAILAPGCAPVARVHPEFEALRPSRIAVLPIANETAYQLDRVTFGGPLQRALIGVEEHDVPELLGGALEEGLVLRGYEALRWVPQGPWAKVDFSRPLATGQAPALAAGLPAGPPATPASEGATGSASGGSLPPQDALPPGGFDAVLVGAIVGWRASTQGSAEAFLRYRLRIHRLPGGEELYGGEFTCGLDARGPGYSDLDLPRLIRASARRALSRLPPQSGG